MFSTPLLKNYTTNFDHFSHMMRRDENLLCLWSIMSPLVICWIIILWLYNRMYGHYIKDHYIGCLKIAFTRQYEQTIYFEAFSYICYHYMLYDLLRWYLQFLLSPRITYLKIAIHIFQNLIKAIRRSIYPMNSTIGEHPIYVGVNISQIFSFPKVFLWDLKWDT